MRSLKYYLIAVALLALINTAGYAQDAPCPIEWVQHCDNDYSFCRSVVFYPCGNNVSWQFDFDKLVTGPNNTVLNVIIASYDRTVVVNAWEYPRGHNRIKEGPVEMTHNYDQLTIMRWDGGGGDFENMDLSTKYETGNPTRPEEP